VHGRILALSGRGGPRRYDRRVPAETTPEHPNLPRRGALGGLIGYALIASTCPSTPTRAEQMLEQVKGFQAHVPSCAWKELGAAVLGTVFAALGAATIAILVMRAHTEWRSHAPTRARSS
jgi:hypothetical protein